MGHDKDAQPLVVFPVGDSSESRLFVELSSFGSDLAEARDALGLAVQASGDPLLADASRHLVAIAVIAYCRTVMQSNVRGRLTDYIAVPDEQIEIHDQVKAFRNATVAHSQSELAVTYAVGVRDSSSLDVQDVAGLTVVIPLPDRVVREFRGLIDNMERRLDEALEPVRARLVKTLAGMNRTQLEVVARPKIQETWAHGFDSRTKRARYPTGHTVYWDFVADAQPE